jgi:hypothetical protein
VSTYEGRASLREFYGNNLSFMGYYAIYFGYVILWTFRLIASLPAAIIYPILQQLESSLIERDLKGKGRCKDIVTRRRMEDSRKYYSKDVEREREDECGICMETCTKMVLPNCSHAMCIKCYRDW